MEGVRNITELQKQKTKTVPFLPANVYVNCQKDYKED